MEDLRLKDPVIFALSLGIRPFPYQVDFLLDDSKRIIWVAGRQSGKTTMAGIKALWYALTHDNSLILIVAPTFRQSQILFDKIRQFILENSWINEKVAYLTKTHVEFKNGSKIISLPSGHEGYNIRGYTADMIIIDEAAYVPDEVYIAIEPALAIKDGTLILIGTPRGKIGRFCQAWISPFFSKHHNTVYDNPLISKEYVEEQKQNMTEAEFRQEFLGEFIEESDTFFPLYLIEQSVEDPKLLKEEIPDHVKYYYYLGVDPARLGEDETAFVIIKEPKDLTSKEPKKVVYWQTLPKTLITDIIARIKDLHYKWKFDKILIDETGLGAGVVDQLMKEIPVVQGITFTHKNRNELYQRLKYDMEKGLLKIPNERKWKEQFHSITYEYTSAGGLKIKKSEQGHDDLVDATALANYGSYLKGGIKVIELEKDLWWRL